MFSNVCAVLLDEMLTSSISLPLEMLVSADNIASREHPRRGAALQVQTLKPYRRGRSAKSVRTQAGLTLTADTDSRHADVPDLILLPTFWRSPLRGVRLAAPLIPWLNKASAAGAQVCTVSTGSFLLAEAGLLQGKAATTHWYYMEQFARRYPDVDLQRRHLITRSGNIFCAGSVNAVADLMIYFISEHFGSATARQVESQFSPEIRRAYRDSLYVEGQADRHHDELVAVLQDALNSNSDKPVRIQDLAAQYDISTRNLNRRFKSVTGLTPLAYLQQKRINDARELLLKTDMTIAEVAAQVGYEDASYFGTLFKRQMLLNPKQYRQSVRGKLFSAA